MAAPLRVAVGAVGLAGHVLPAIALARELDGRGHEVLVQTSERWRETVQGLGLRFAGGEGPDEAGAGNDARLVEKVRRLRPAIAEFGPDLVVSDAFSVGSALAAELEGVRRASLFPQVYPVHEGGLPLFAMGLMPPRTRLGSLGWRLARTVWGRLPSTRSAQAMLNRDRAELGLPPLAGLHGPLSQRLTMVATFPQLEYPRRWPAHVRVTGPMVFDPPHPAVRIPEGDAPLVLVAPSTVKDPQGKLVETALEALEGEPVRVVATMSGGLPPVLDALPPNVVVADWIDYSEAMPAASLVVSNGTHGTVVRAIAEGVPLAIAPALPDDAEHGARVSWAGVGLTLPRRLLTPGALRLAVRKVLGDRRFAERARQIAAWSARRNGAAEGARLVERCAVQ